MPDFSVKQRPILFLFFLTLLIPLFIQLKEINRPYLGHFGSYQGTVMAAIARNYQEEKFSDIFLPKTDLIIYGNKKSLHLNQFPLPSLIAGLAASLMGGNLEFWGRFQAILFHLGSLLVFFFWIRKFWGEKQALVGTFVLAYCPQTLIYGQAFMNESCALFFLLSSFFFFQNWRDSERTLMLMASGIFFALTLVNRIHWIVFFPFFLFLILKKRNNLILNSILFLLTSTSLPFLWTYHTYQAALENTNVHTSFLIQLLNPQESSSGDFSSPSFYFDLAKALSKIISLPCTPLFLWGIWKSISIKRFRWFTFIFACGFLIVFLAPQKIIRHDFYLYSLAPLATLLIILGAQDISKRINVSMMLPFGIITIMLAAVMQSAHPLWKISPTEFEDYHLITQAKRLIPKQSKVIIANGSPAPLYYLDRSFWTIDFESTNPGLAPYAADHQLRKASAEDIEQIANWRKDPIKGIHDMTQLGASYLLVLHKEKLAARPEILLYLNAHAVLISNPQDPFSLFRLNS